MIGNSYGSLVVIGFDSESQTAFVKCKCNNVEGYVQSDLTTGNIRQCRKCDRRSLFIDSITRELIRLNELDLEPERAERIVDAFIKHIEERWIDARTASFTKFVDVLMDEDSENGPTKEEINICRSITSSIRRTGMRSAADFVSREQTIIANGVEPQITSHTR